MTYYNYLDQPMPESANATSFVTGNDPQGGEVWTAPPGPSSVSGDGGGDTLVGSDGDNIFYITNPNDIIDVADGQPGVKTAIAYTSYTLPANVENLDVYNDFNFAVGNNLGNLIEVSGRQWVDGEGGNNVLVGGSGDATFVEQVHRGSDVIYDWHSGDRVQLLGTSLATFAEIQSAMVQTGNDVVLNMTSTETLTFRDTTIADFTPDEFLVPLDPSLLGAMTFNGTFNTLNLYNPTTNTGVWQTNFGGNLQDAWAYQLVSNGELEAYMTPSFVGSGDQPLGIDPFSVSGGILTITAAPLPPADQQAAYFAQYSSGMINTLGTFSQKYGYFVMDAKLPDATGAWPAFWMEQDPWVPDSEADIMESLGITPTVDYVRADGGNQSLYDNVLKTNPSGWNTYGLLWTPTTVTFYLDGVAVLSGTTPSSWDQPMSLIANLAVGGWGGTPNASEFPAQMEIAYIRAYALADGASVVVHSTPVPPAATIRANGSPVSSTSSTAQIQPVKFHGGAPVTSDGIIFLQSAPHSGDLPAGTNMLVWEDSGAVFGAESNGTVLAPATTLLAGTIDQFVGGSWLNDGNVALVYTENDNGVEDIWSLVFNSKTSSISKQELGPGAGDAQVVATSYGGFAVSWNYGSAVDCVAYSAQAYSGDGWYGALRTLSGNLLGTDSLGKLVAAVAGNPSEVQLYIIDNAAATAPALVSVTPTTISETVGSTGLTPFTFTLTRSYNLTGTSVVSWMVQGDGAQPAPTQDFQNDVLPTGTVTFAPGVSQATVTIYVQDASEVHNDDTFTFTLTQATGTNLGAAVADATILIAGGSDPTGTVETAAASFTMPSGAHDVILTGSTAQTVVGNNLADIMTSNNFDSTLIGGGGTDALIAGYNADTLTGGSGKDTFVFPVLPWNAGHITNFNPGIDTLYLSHLFAAGHYTGSNPIADGWLSFVTDGSGGTDVYFDPGGKTGNSIPILITILDHVSPQSITATDWIYH
jgi:beta-glucanase (GH16 family)